MKAKVLGISLIVAMLVSAVPAFAAPEPPDYKPVDVGPEIRGWEANTERITGAPGNFDGLDYYSSEADAEYPCYSGNTREWLSLDDYNGYYFFTEFHLIAESSGAELWVQGDMSYPEGDPRATPVVTCDQAEYLVSEFDAVMYPEETSFFGMPDFHDGTGSLLELWGYFDPGTFFNAAGRQVILVSNVRDDAFYDYTYPNYIAGFYSPSFEAYFDRNVMSIDSHDWANRVGPDGSRPYLYEGVFAHEYQHLLHDDYDSDEVNWVNEGLSMFAEFLTGYALGNDAYSTFEELPENSLTAWGDQGGREIVADYGLVFLWHMYMYEKYGQEFIQDEFHNPLNDISSINDSLGNIGSSDTFQGIFPDFSVAVLIDSEDYPEYEFENHDVNIEVGPPGRPNPDAYDTPGAPPWGTDYISLNGHESIKNLVFNGVEFNPTLWKSDGDTLFGGSGDLIDNFLIAEVDLTGVTGATLTFDTMFDIEFAWDYGFVQVSPDGGVTWFSLSNADTCSDLDPDALPKIVAMVPGFTGVSGFGCNDPYAEPSYPEAQWISTSFDLSAYDGMTILVAFRYVTDWSYNEPGWYVDNVDIAGSFSSDGSTTEGFQSINEVRGISNAYTVHLVGERNRRGSSEYEVLTILSGGLMEEWNPIAELFDNYRNVVMLVTYDAPEGVSGYADYNYDLVSGGGKVFKK